MSQYVILPVAENYVLKGWSHELYSFDSMTCWRDIETNSFHLRTAFIFYMLSKFYHTCGSNEQWGQLLYTELVTKVIMTNCSLCSNTHEYWPTFVMWKGASSNDVFLDMSVSTLCKSSTFQQCCWEALHFQNRLIIIISLGGA